LWLVGGYSLADAARILKVSPRQLRSWRRSSLLAPNAEGGAAPALDFRALVAARALAGLRRSGVTLARIERSLAQLRDRVPELEDPLAALRVWGECSGRIAVRHAGGWIEPDGQMLLDFSAASSAPIIPAAARCAASAAPIGRAERARAHFERGCRLDWDASTHAEAIEAYLSAIALDPEHADAHCNLGAIYFTQERWALARERFECALALVPSHREARLNLGMVCEELGQDAAALRHYRAVLAQYPLHAQAHAHLALLCERLALKQRARRHWRRYLELEPRGQWAELARHCTSSPRDRSRS
jgi:tetratricopeptide (TPR) repeat protein